MKKILNEHEYKINILKNNEEDDHVYRVNYEHFIDNGIITVFVSSDIGIQNGYRNTYYDVYYYDYINDIELSIDEYVNSYGKSYSVLLEKLNNQGSLQGMTLTPNDIKCIIFYGKRR